MPLLIQILIVGLFGLLNGCYVGEGIGYLRFEGRVSNEEGQSLDGKEVRIQWSSTESHPSARNRRVDDLAYTQNGGKFAIETGGIVGVLVLAPIGVIVTPIGAIIAALTPWTNSEVQDFLRPSYTLGSDCFDHPKFISLRIESGGYETTFVEKDIVRKLYRGTGEKKGGFCRRVYDLGLITLPTSEPSR